MPRIEVINGLLLGIVLALKNCIFIQQIIEISRNWSLSQILNARFHSLKTKEDNKFSDLVQKLRMEVRTAKMG